MRYMVMTTKHHEGFCLFDSKLTDYCAPKQCPGRDRRDVARRGNEYPPPFVSTNNVRIVTDSTCDLPRDIVERLGITVVPLTVFFGEEALLDGVERLCVIDAVKLGDRAAVAALIRQKADVNAAEADGTTALHWASYRDDEISAELLIRELRNPCAAARPRSARAMPPMPTPACIAICPICVPCCMNTVRGF